MLGHGASMVRSGLVLHLDAGNVKSYPGSGTVWKDLSGLGNDGTLVNGVGYNSDNKGSMVFDGVNDRVQFPYYPSLNIGGLNITLSCWIKPTGLANALHGAGIVSRISGYNDGLYEIILINSSSTNYTFFRMLGIGTHSPRLIPLSLNKIYNIVCVYDNGSMKNYVNSVAEGDPYVRNINIITSTSREIRVGDRVTQAPFPGSMYQISIYNRALSDQEIRQNFNALRGRYGI